MGLKPSGTVTFLFTDIENSTRLARELAEAWEPMRQRHHALLKTAIEAHEGYIFQVIGDAFCAAFHTPIQALKAAYQAQRSLEDESWGEKPIKVRMGIHTGTAELLSDGQYQGYLAMSRVQRVMSAGHGGQVLFSASATALLGEDRPDGITLRDLGEKRLKDLTQPEHIFQLIGPNLEVDFPPLRTLENMRHNLPPSLTSFIGRERELAEIHAYLKEARLLTLIGPGGTGKTRLSLRVAADCLEMFPDGAWVLELAPLTAPEYVVPSLATLFGLRETSGMPLNQLVVDYLRAKQLMLIFDNCEHLIEAVAQLAEQLLHACPSLQLIASSREALGIAGETIYQVPPLSLPAPLVSAESIKLSEAGRLFVERAAKAEPRFELTEANATAVAQICRRLDGIPLAIELAAVRVKVFSPQQISERLNDRFRLLSGGSRTALPRQQTLRALIDWSYVILDESEQRLFRQLAVFKGGWTFEAMEAVCQGVDVMEGLFGLVNKSLVNVEEREANTRYHFLETIREYALEKLEAAGEAEDGRDRLLDYCLALSDQDDPSTMSPQSSERLTCLEAEHDNLRAVLEWATEERPTKALLLVDRLSGFWSMRNYHEEARYWCQKILSRTEGLPGLDLSRARVFGNLGWEAAIQGDHQTGYSASEAGLEIARQLDDTKLISRTLNSLAFSSIFLGEIELAEKTVQESENIARKLGHKAEYAMALAVKTQIALVAKEDLAAGKIYVEEALAIGQAIGLHWVISFSLYGLGHISGASGDLKTARRWFDEACQLGDRMGNRQMLYVARSDLAHMLRENGELEEPLAIYKEVIIGWKEFGHRAAVAHELECMAFIYRKLGQDYRAATLLGAAEILRQRVGAKMTDKEANEYDLEVAALRQNLVEAVLKQAWEAGRKLSMDEAIALAIREVDQD